MPLPDSSASSPASRSRRAYLVGRVHDGQVQVGPVEPRVDDLGVGDAQLPDDVVDDLVGGRRRHGHHRGVSQLLDHAAQLEVVGAEVVAPLAHAVRLVDHEKVDRRAAQQRAELGLGQLLGRGVDELLAAPRHDLLGLLPLARRHRAVEGNGIDAFLGEGFSLVLHQGDERADHERRAVHHQPGELEAEALPRSRRHQRHGVAARQCRADDLLLPGPELAEAEVLAQRGPQPHAGRRGDTHVGSSDRIGSTAGPSRRPPGISLPGMVDESS